MSNSLRPHGLQHARPPCPSPTSGVCSNSCPLNRWCHPTSHPLSSPSPALNISQREGLFKWVNSSHEVAKLLEFQPQHQSFQWTPRITFFRMDWLDLLVVQGTFKSLLQLHNLKESILQCSTLFMVQLSHPYMSTGKTTALTRFSLVIYFIHSINSVYMSIPIFQFIPSPSFPPWCSYVCS